MHWFMLLDFLLLQWKRLKIKCGRYKRNPPYPMSRIISNYLSVDRRKLNMASPSHLKENNRNNSEKVHRRNRLKMLSWNELLPWMDLLQEFYLWNTASARICQECMDLTFFAHLSFCAYTVTETFHSCDSQNCYFIWENRIVFLMHFASGISWKHLCILLGVSLIGGQKSIHAFFTES